MRGLAGGVPAHRNGTACQLLRGVHPHRRLECSNQHAKWLRVTTQFPGRRTSLNFLLASMSGNRVTRLYPPGSRLHRPRRQQESRRCPRVPAAQRQRQSFGSPTNSRAVRQDNCFRRPAGERVTSREGLAATRSGQHSVAPVLPVPLLQRAAQAAILTTHSDVSSTISSANSHGSWVRNDRGCLRGRSRDLGDPRVPARHREHQVPARGTASRSG